MSDKVQVNRKIEQAAGQGLKTAEQAAPAQSNIGKAIGAANTALGVYGQVMGFTGGLAEKALLPIMQQLSFLQGLACLPASSHLDPIMGIDVHFVMIPPSPSPIPMPHPFIAMVMDPKDWLSCAVMTVAAMAAPVPTGNDDADAAAALAFTVATMALGMAGMSATVKLGSFTPRSVTGVKNKVIPHFPMGASFAPMPVLKNSGHVQFGSLFMLADGNPFTGMMHLNNDCWDVGIMQLLRKKYPAEPMHLYMPTGFIMAIPSHNVIVNPIPTPINPIAALTKLLNFGLAKLLHGIIGKMPFLGRVGNALSKAICHVTGHPVDVVSGMLFTDEEDFALPGVIPLSWERTWYSDSVYQGPLGHGWYHNYDMGFFIDETGQGVFRLNDGRPAVFELPERGKFTFNRTEKLWLHCHTTEGYYYIINNEGLIHRFTTRQYDHASHKQKQHLLQSISNHNGYAIRFEYNTRGNLVKLIDSAGRVLTVTNDLDGRIIEIQAPHPVDAGKTFAIARYQYDDDGNMICHTDALEQPMKYEYENHLLVKETWRDGQEWYFEYEGKTNGSRCIHTWGPDNLYNHRLTYLEGVTHVENSLGYITTYNHKKGLLYSKIDANGAEWGYRYNRFNELEWETDPLGNQQSYTHDEWGNIATTTDPAGGFTYTEYYNPQFPYLPTEAMDKAGGKWKWEYDEHGNLIVRTDPSGNITLYSYNDGLVAKVVNEIGSQTIVIHDSDHNITSVQRHTGDITRLMYNNLGACTKVINAVNKSQERIYDLKGRLKKLHDFDDNIILLEYDGIDNIVNYKDHYSAIQYAYRGLWKPVSKTSGETTVYYIYDTEEQLLKVVNEHGMPYRLSRDVVGNIIEETGYDQATHHFTRNAAGWITEEVKPSGKKIKYQYDACGRVVQILYADGNAESFVYRPDGRMIKATNKWAESVFERNVCGDIIKEIVNGEWVTREVNAFGNTVHLISSLGANINYRYSAMGYALETEANGWKAACDYNEFGLEATRFLPGGVVNRRQYDKAGRLIMHQVSPGPGGDQSLFNRRYRWNTGERLKQINRGVAATMFEYDDRGNLAKTIFGDGEIQYRNPNAVGSLFKTPDRADRTYTGYGRLKKANGWEFAYDGDGFLVKKSKSNGESWHYNWDDAGRLVEVKRPDDTIIEFTYDALGRRLSKQYKNTVTRFFWSGNVLLHEWKAPAKQGSLSGSEALQPITTWVFDADSFSPAAKIKGDKRYSIVTDHHATPVQMYGDEGRLFWECELDTYGKVRMEKGEKSSCPFRYRGQYEDMETGLYYNRFRYYDPDDGLYICQDPIRLNGNNPNLYAYVNDTNIYDDVFGLDYKRTQKAINKIKENAKDGKVRRGSDYHGRLTPEMEAHILANPQGVYQAPNGNLIFHHGENIVVTHGPGSSQGNVITSYGSGGPRGDSGAAIFGGSPSDPGQPITPGMITGGQIPKPDGGFLPPATQVQ